MPTDMQKTLPKGWKWVRLGEVASKEKFAIRMGPFGSQLKKDELVNEGVKVLWIENIINNTFEWKDNKCITSSKFQQLQSFQVKPNDVLTTTMGTIGRSCVVPENIGQAIISSHLLKISLDFTIAKPEFLARYLTTPYAVDYFDKSSHGIVMKGLNTSIIKNLPILLPPLPTQHKIVEILEEADNLRKLRQQADEKMKDLIPSLFVQMFGDPATNPKGWRVKKLGEICSVKGGKRLPKGAKFSSQMTDFPYIRVVDFKDGSIDTDNLMYLDKEIQKQIKRYIINKTDVYISIAGTIGLVGIIPDRLDGANLTENAAKLVINYSSLVIRDYLARFLQTPVGQLRIRQRTNAVGQPKLALERIATIEIPIPPFSLQQEFTKLVEDIEAEKARQVESKKKLDELFNSLMQRAFTGELVK